MGQGSTFCANLKCSTKHRSDEQLDIKQGQLFVLKTTFKKQKVAYASPTISSDKVDPDMIEKWLGMNQTLHTWTRIFRVVKSSLEAETFVTQDELMAEKRAIKETREYKTPKKIKVDEMFETSNISNYSPFQSSDAVTPEENAQAYMVHVESTLSLIHI